MPSLTPATAATGTLSASTAATIHSQLVPNTGLYPAVGLHPGAVPGLGIQPATAATGTLVAV